MNAQNFDISQKPEPLREKEFSFPDYEVKYLENALKVYLIEDKEQPLVFFNLALRKFFHEDNDPALEMLMTEMILKGTNKLTDEEISEKLEQTASNLFMTSNRYTYRVHGMALEKNLDTFLEVLGDVLNNADFPQDELDKTKKHAKTNLRLMKSNSFYPLRKLSAQILHGADHPFAKIPEEDQVEDITREMLVNNYLGHFTPNNGILVVTGDFDAEEMIEELEKYLGNWKKGRLYDKPVPDFNKAEPGSYFVQRPNSAQSSIKISTKAPGISEDDFYVYDILTDYMGSSFNGRLYKVLREDSSYAYSTNAFIDTLENENFAHFVANVNKESTFESLKLMTTEIEKLEKDKPEAEILESIKSFHLGNYLREFEEPLHASEYLIRKELFDIKIDSISDYVDKIRAIKPEDIQNIAKKYSISDNYTFILGDTTLTDSIIDMHGTKLYDKDLNQLSKDSIKIANGEITHKFIIDQYVKALGGKDEIDSLETLVTYGDVTVKMGDEIFKGELLRKQTDSTQMYQHLEVGLIDRKVWVDNDSIKVSFRNGNVEDPGKELSEMYRFQAKLFNTAKIFDLGFNLVSVTENDKYYRIEAKDPQGLFNYVYSFSKNDNLLKEVLVADPEGNETKMLYDDYKKFGNVTLPGREVTINPNMEIEIIFDYKINNTLNMQTFKPF